MGTGLTLAFNRSIATLADDLKSIRPTILMSVPRVYDMIYGKLRDGLAKKPAYVRYLFNSETIDVQLRTSEHRSMYTTYV